MAIAFLNNGTRMTEIEWMRIDVVKNRSERV